MLSIFHLIILNKLYKDMVPLMLRLQVWKAIYGQVF